MGNKAYVYALKHIPTGKIYVGSTKNVKKRIIQHMSLLKSGTHTVKNMQDDFNKYGGDYSFYILFEAYAAYDAHLVERHFMSLLDTRNPAHGYNYKDLSKGFTLENYKEHKIEEAYEPECE